MTTVIRTENLGKKYLIGGSKEPYATLRDSVMAFVRSPFRRSRPSSQTIWALKDVSFEVKQGDAVGIIGRNGAGKSTLLKVLSRITEPSEGRVRLSGRTASLLEVGTGFHPELTGRENIYLNGAILGMTKAEIKSRFDQIVDFAEVEMFLDTPVKRYSSGMYMRLAFAVAAHLEPDILLVDEVLAVGDAQFQKKCIGRMDEVTREGRTVLFISHNMPAVSKLCPTSCLLDKGKLIMMAETEQVVKAYLDTGTPQDETQSAVFEDNQAAPLCLLGARLIGGNGVSSGFFSLRDPITIEIDYRVLKDIRDSFLILRVSRDGVAVFQAHDTDLHPDCLENRPAGTYRTRVQLPARFLAPGRYNVTLRAAIGPLGQFGYDDHPDVLTFEIGETEEDTAYKGHAALRRTLVVAEFDWQTEQIAEQPGSFSEP